MGRCSGFLAQHLQILVPHEKYRREKLKEEKEDAEDSAISVVRGGAWWHVDSCSSASSELHHVPGQFGELARD
jgi:hypothetical protein